MRGAVDHGLDQRTVVGASDDRRSDASAAGEDPGQVDHWDHVARR